MVTVTLEFGEMPAPGSWARPQGVATAPDRSAAFVCASRLVTLTVAALSLCTSLHAQEPAQPVSGRSADSRSSRTNALTEAAVQQGVLNCASRINQVSLFLGFGAQAGVLLMAHPNQPDQRLVPLAMEVAGESGSAYVSASFAPNQANGCGAAYDAVVYWPQKCDVVAAAQFAGFPRAGLMKRAITMLDGGPYTKVFLMPAGSGCVSIKKEVVL